MVHRGAEQSCCTPHLPSKLFTEFTLFQVYILWKGWENNCFSSLIVVINTILIPNSKHSTVRDTEKKLTLPWLKPGQEPRKNIPRKQTFVIVWLSSKSSNSLNVGRTPPKTGHKSKKRFGWLYVPLLAPYLAGERRIQSLVWPNQYILQC